MRAADEVVILDLRLLIANLSGDAVAVAQVLDLFCDQARDYAAQLLCQAEASSRRAVVHALRGSALTVGANRLALACEQAEAGGGIDAVMAAVDDVLVAITAYDPAVSPADAGAGVGERSRSQTPSS
jgi:HPt (histidine-containing phosphotransfer) domain-containing protein